jgi:hypothetical protein
LIVKQDVVRFFLFVLPSGGGGGNSPPRATEEDGAGSQGTSTSLLPSWAGTSDASGSGGFGSRQTRISPSLGSFIDTEPQATKASCFTAVRNLEGYLQGKDEGEVEGLVDRIGVMGIGGESGFVDWGKHEARAAAAGRPNI